MKEERTMAQFGRMPVQRLSWPAIFGGTFFALGIALILSFFGLAIGAAVAGTRGATQGVGTWAGIWSLVTLFFGFVAGGWLAAKASGSRTKTDGRLHGIVTWALGTTAIFYFVVNSTGRLAGLLAGMTGYAGLPTVTAGSVNSITVAAATWALIAGICGLIGGIVGGHAGSYEEIVAPAEVRRAA